MNLTIIIGNRNYSSWSLRAWIVLAKTGSPYETVRIPLDTPDFYRQIKELSPTRTVPVLRHDSLTITDSLAINEYLAELFPDAKLWPSSMSARAEARAISCEMHSSFAAVREEMPMNCRATGRVLVLSKAAESQVARINSLLSHYLNAERDGPWLFGRFSIADAMYLPIMFRFNTYQIAMPDNVKAYMNMFFSDSDVKQWVSAAMEETEVLEDGERGIT